MSINRLTMLRLAAAKLDTKLREYPDNPSAPGWKRRLEEYAISIKNLSEGRPEFPIEGPIGVNVGVPRDTGRKP